VRHNLSSGRAFLKGERCGGDRGKGFFWSVDEKFSQTLEEQELKVQQAAAAAAQGIVPNPAESSKSRRKDKGALLEPPLKRSVKGDTKGGPLPPPLTSSPLAFKTTTPMPLHSGSTGTIPATKHQITSPNPVTTTLATTGVFAYPAHTNSSQRVSVSQTSASTSAYPGTQLGSANPYASLSQPNWATHPNLAGKAPVATSSSHAPNSTTSQPATQTQPLVSQTAVPDVIIPIILGPIPPTHPDYAPGHPNNSAKEGYMVLHERKLILDPDVFAELTKEMLEQLEKMGAPTALGILTGHMIRALKERRARERGKDRGARRPKGAGRGGAAKKAAAATGPFTNVPLDQKRKPAGPNAADAPSEPGGSANIEDTNMDTQPTSTETTSPSVTPGGADTPQASAQLALADPGSPIIVVDEDSGEEGPAVKKRKIDGGLALASA